jgi:serine/threonine protein kinase
MSEEEIFHQALARQDPEESAAYLQQACGDDAASRASVEALLQADIGATGFMDRPPPDPDATFDAPIGERLGTMIGPYKLLQEIGEGGMGTVFMAEQVEPVQRKVALKVVRPVMDSRQILARFEAERQALAMMDHPNIAKVLDAGTTPTGRPYFVMELVKGVPITDYRDQNHLNPRERLELFVPVCQAVQHAHQKKLTATDRAFVHRQTQWWLGESDFASVRDPTAVESLAPDEREAWRKLWADVRELRDRSAPQADPRPMSK